MALIYFFRKSLKAALEAVWHVPCGGVAYGDDNCVFIANDWHTALLPVYLEVSPSLEAEGEDAYREMNLIIHLICSTLTSSLLL